MKYISTRNNKKTFEFKDVFIKGLADDGGLFIPETLNKYSNIEINSFRELEYSELAKKIISTFIGDFMSEQDLSKIIDQSYSVFRKKNVVDLVEMRSIIYEDDSLGAKYNYGETTVGTQLRASLLMVYA